MATPDDPGAEILAALQRGESVTAVSRANEAISQNPHDAELYSLRGLALAETGWEAAKGDLEQACALEPQEPRWALHLAIGARKNSIWETAIAAYGRAAALTGGAEVALVGQADCLMAADRPAEARDIYRHVVSQPGARPTLHHRLAKAQRAAGDVAAAFHTLSGLKAAGNLPDTARLDLGTLEVQMHRFEAAEVTFSALLKDQPGHAGIALEAAALARTRGDKDLAKARLETALSHIPHSASLLAARLDLGDAEPAFLQQAEEIAASEEAKATDRQLLLFSLAGLADQRGEVDRAWDLATKANALYPPQEDKRFNYRWQMDRALEIYDTLAPPAPSENSAGPGLLYIIGPPRSGGSVLQSVLAAAPDAASMGERGALMLPILEILAGSPDAAVSTLRALKDPDIAGMKGLAPQADFFIDKTPHQAHIAGLITHIHPQAQFVDVRRDPIDCLVSMYLKPFSAAFPFTQSVGGIADYLVAHRELIDAWRHRGVPIHLHSHDAFVQDPRVVGAALAEAVCRPWSDDALSPAQRQGTVRTFSADQVTEAVGAQFRGRGERYRSFIEKTAEIDGKFWDLSAASKD